MGNNGKGGSAGGAAAKKQMKDFINALGAMGEMAHQVYMSLIGVGADRQEATAAMTAWIAAFWHETCEDARRKKGDANGDAENPG